MEIYLANSLLIKGKANIQLPRDVLVLCHTKFTSNIQRNNTVSDFFCSRAMNLYCHKTSSEITNPVSLVLAKVM